MNSTKKNTRKAAMDMERFSWQVFRFKDDGRKWKTLAEQRRAYAVKAANSANPDGTSITLGAETFTKAAGKISTAFTRLGELAEMGVMLPELHIDRDGCPREKLSERGTKVRRLRFDSLNQAQAIIDSGQMFEGHVRLTAEQQREIQESWLSEAPKGLQDSPENAPKGIQHSPKGLQDRTKDSKIAPKGIQPIRWRQPKNLTEKEETEKKNRTADGSSVPLSTPKAASKEKAEHPWVIDIVREALSTSDAAHFETWDRMAISEVLYKNPDFEREEALTATRLFIGRLRDDDSGGFKLTKAGKGLAGRFDAEILNAREYLAKQKYAMEQVAQQIAARKIEEETKRQEPIEVCSVGPSGEGLF